MRVKIIHANFVVVIICWWIENVSSWRRLRTNINVVQKYMDFNIEKPNVISFSRNTNSVHFNYHIGDVLICVCTV
jgi:hypothetical protein